MTKPGYTHVSIIADRSGSMIQIADDMNGGIRTFLIDQAEQPGELTISVMRFDSHLDWFHSFATAEEVITGGDIIEPRGSTALYDAMATEMLNVGEVLADMAEEERPEKVIILVITDGMENASRRYTYTQVRDMVKQQTEQYKWDFVFLGANIDAVAVGTDLGFAEGQSMTYTANAGGVGSVLRSASAYVSKGRSGQAAEFSDEDRAAASGN